MGLGVAHTRRPNSQSSPCPGLVLPSVAIFRPGYCDGLNVTRQPRAGYTLIWLPLVCTSSGLAIACEPPSYLRAATLPSMISPRASVSEAGVPSETQPSSRYSISSAR